MSRLKEHLLHDWRTALAMVVVFLLVAVPVLSLGMIPYEQLPEKGLIPLALLGLYLASSFCLLAGFYLYEDYRLIVDTPTSPVQSASMGRVELKGSARTDDPLQLPEIGECVYYHVRIEKDGKNRGSETLLNERKLAPFHLRDETGEARIVIDDNPAMYTTRDVTQGQGFLSEFKPWAKNLIGTVVDEYERKGPGGTWINQDGKHVFDGYHGHGLFIDYIAPGEDVYVLGEARSDGDAGLAVGEDPATHVFIVSDQPEDELASGLAAVATMLLGFGILMAPTSYILLIGYLTPLSI